MADLATGQVRAVTHDRALVYSPVWSADDRFLYFASGRGGTVNIWKMPSGGGEPQQITAGQGDDADLSLSADGKRLVFSTYRQNINIGVADLDDEGPERRLEVADLGRRARGAGPRLLSRRQAHRVLFQSQGGRTGRNLGHGRGRLQPAPLVVDDYQNVFPRWYADGQALFFRSSHARLGLPATGSGAWRFRAGLPRSSCPEPLGLMADVDSQGRILGNDAQGRGAIYDPKTKQTRVLEACAGSGFRWSPDGRRIAYIGPAGGLQAGLWVYDFQSAPRQVFSGWLVNFAWTGPRSSSTKRANPT